MGYCTNCGAALGGGRFCTSCGAPTGTPATASAPGHPVPGGDERAAERTTERTSERPAESTAPRLPPVPPAPASPPPGRSGSPVVPPTPQAGAGGHGGPRYPLFADEVDSATRPVPVVPADEGPTGHRDARRGFPVWAMALAVAVALLVVVGGIYAVTRGGDDDTAGGSGSTPTSGSGEESEGSSTPPQQSGDTPGDLAGQSTATGPRPIPPGRDLKNRPVTYPPANMLDDDTTTAYRMPGDASGATITFELPKKAVISEVGLINGYAKKDRAGNRTVDWYAKNRKILEVEWLFDDGSSVVQNLRTEPVLQTIVVNDISTRTIRMRIVQVSAPGKPPLRKDVTAISDVLLRGKP